MPSACSSCGSPPHHSFCCPVPDVVPTFKMMVTPSSAVRPLSPPSPSPASTGLVGLGGAQQFEASNVMRTSPPACNFQNLCCIQEDEDPAASRLQDVQVISTSPSSASSSSSASDRIHWSPPNQAHHALHQHHSAAQQLNYRFNNNPRISITDAHGHVVTPLVTSSSLLCNESEMMVTDDDIVTNNHPYQVLKSDQYFQGFDIEYEEALRFVHHIKNF